jgi:hypothetical protein
MMRTKDAVEASGEVPILLISGLNPVSGKYLLRFTICRHFSMANPAWTLFLAEFDPPLPSWKFQLSSSA